MGGTDYHDAGVQGGDGGQEPSLPAVQFGSPIDTEQAVRVVKATNCQDVHVLSRKLDFAKKKEIEADKLRV